MRIGITMMSHDTRLGGPGTYTCEVVSRLLAMDRQNEYVLIYPAFGLARDGFGQYRELPNVLEVETAHSRVSVTEYWDQLIVPTVARRHGVDVLFEPLMTVPIRGRFGKVVVMHGVDIYTMPEALDWSRTLRWRFMLKYVLPAADRVISVSDTLTGVLAKVPGFQVDRVRRTYLGVSPRFRKVDDQTRLDKFRQTHRLDKPYILFVGMLFPSKGAGCLFRAFARLLDQMPHDLVVIGGVRWKYQAELDLIRSLGIGDRVRMLDYMTPDDLALAYNLADCFVYPSLFETFGLAQLEAMACGCPVVAANTGSIPEIAGDGAILADPRNTDELASAILRVVQDRSLRDDLMRRGFARAGQFTWERCAAETLDVLRELA